MNATLSDYREASRKRGKRYRERLLAEGRKHVNLIVSGECHQALTDEKRRSGMSFSEIVERAVFDYVHRDVEPSPARNVTSNDDERKGGYDRIEVLNRIRELETMKDQGEITNRDEMAEILNTEGIRTKYGKPWTERAISSIIGRARKAGEWT